MNLRSILPIAAAAALATLAAHPAYAETGKSRAQVRAELNEALRTGQTLVAGEIGLPQQALRPDLFPSIAMAQGRSREEVRDELAQAIRAGDIVAGESSARRNEVHPGLYPPVAMVAGKSRDQARAELAEALRRGDILVGGERLVTRREQFPLQYQDAMQMMAERR